MRKIVSVIVLCLMALTMSAQKCAVLEFRGSASVSLADIDGISEMFMTYFRPSGYTMVERAQIDKVISEQQFQRSNITDNQAVQVGKILNASIVILGKISKLGGQYQVDVRAVAVQSGHDIALEGATFSGDYRTNVRNLATKLAGKVAITSGGTVSAAPSQPAQTQRKRTTVEIVYGYLKVFPNELGTFDAEPTSVIAQINKQAQHGYNNWRLPTNEELSLLRANNYLGNGQYMTRERKNGIVLLVTDGDNYATIHAKEQEQQRKANLRAQGWIDLGLPSGTLWKDQNESGFYSFNQAVANFGYSLPTKKQFEELKSACRWTWTGSGYKVVGPNGASIVLPAASFRFKGHVYNEYAGECGYYWSSTTNGSETMWYLRIMSDRVDLLPPLRETESDYSVRLVKNP